MRLSRSVICSSWRAIGTRSSGDRDVDGATVAALLRRHLLDAAHRDQAVDAPVDAVGGKRREVVAHDVLIDEQLHGDPGRDDHRVLRHDVADEHALECVTRLLAVSPRPARRCPGTSR